MHLHYLTLSRQVEDLRRRLRGARVVGSYTQRKNEWIWQLMADERESALLIGCDGQFPAILHLDSAHRGRNSAPVMAAIVARTISDITIAPDERLVTIAFADSDQRILIRLFALRANAFLVDQGGRIVDAFKNARKHVGAIFKLSGAARLPIPDIDGDTLLQLLTIAAERPIEAVLKQVQHMNGTLLSEVLSRAQIDPRQPAAEMDAIACEKLITQMATVAGECRSGQPRIYYDGEQPRRLAILELQTAAGLREERFDDLNRALRHFAFQSIKYREVTGRQQRLVTALDRRLKSLRHSVQQLRNRPSDPEKKAHFQRIGELLNAQPQAMIPGREEIDLIDYYHPQMETVRVKVDPRRSARENAERYFQKARRYDDRMADDTRRGAELERQIAEAAQLREKISACSNIKTLEGFEAQLGAARILQGSRREEQQLRVPYKTYTFGGFEILVGKNARDNDALTFRHAAKEDVWLHVQGHAGSHVIISNPQRREQIPHEVLMHAAGLAVTHSAAKHASYIPVLYTRVKYVRKPRKAAPGAVIPSHEKTVYADPVQA